MCEKIWDKFEMKNMGSYHNQYLKKDVFLLADVFEKFISACLESYELDPCHYFSSLFQLSLFQFILVPGSNWDAILKITGVKLEKISDIDMYLLTEKGLRGGISYITKRYAKANNKYTRDDDPKKPSTFITYLDMNNLYGWAMSEYLPYGELKWLKIFDEFDVMSISQQKKKQKKKRN